MEDLSRIKSRLESLSELDELVGALRSISASRAREAQAAFEGTRAYRNVVTRAMAEVAPLLPDAAEASDRNKESGESCLLLIASENGFVGLFNSRLVERALDVRDPREHLVIVGRRGQITAAENGVADADTFPMTSRISGVTALARRIAKRLAGMSSARIVHAAQKPGANFEVQVRTVLHVPKIPASESASPPILHIPPKELLSHLADEYLFAEIAHALMVSLASENVARMRAMDSASRNIEDTMDKLRRDERVAQQEKTTTEMLDVVTGAEAVEQN